MSIKIANLLVKIGADTSEVNKGLSETSAKLNETSNAGQKLSSAFQSFAMASMAAIGVFTAVNAALQPMIEYIKKAIVSASQLAESENKVVAVFSNSADVIVRWSETAATSLGMSSQQALEAAGSFGNLFRAMEISELTNAKMSEGLVKLAADLASFNNMNPEEVLEKLKSGITGQLTALKSLGVNLNDAVLKERALEMALWDGSGALDAKTKALVTYNLIMKQTSMAQGDFNRTSGDLANQQRILQANIETLSALIGNEFLPLQESMVKAENDVLAGVIENMTARQKEKQILRDLNITYDHHLGYIRNGVLLTAEEANAVLAAEKANQAWTDSLNGQADAYYTLHPEIERAADATTALVTEQDVLQGKMNELQTILAGSFGKELDSYNEKMKTNAEKTQEVKDRIDELNQKSWLTKAQENELASLEERLISLGDEATRLKEAHETAMKTMAMNMLIAKASSDRLTINEIDNISKIMVAWGLWDEKTAEVVENINGINLDDANLEISELKELILSMPSSSTYTLTLNAVITESFTQAARWIEKGSVVSVKTGNTITTIDPSKRTVTPQALGGPVWAGGTYQVNERGTEFFTPGVSGYITPANQTNNQNKSVTVVFPNAHGEVDERRLLNLLNMMGEAYGF